MKKINPRRFRKMFGLGTKGPVKPKRRLTIAILIFLTGLGIVVYGLFRHFHVFALCLLPFWISAQFPVLQLETDNLEIRADSIVIPADSSVIDYRAEWTQADSLNVWSNHGMIVTQPNHWTYGLYFKFEPSDSTCLSWSKGGYSQELPWYPFDIPYYEQDGNSSGNPYGCEGKYRVWIWYRYYRKNLFPFWVRQLGELEHYFEIKIVKEE
jgi:hypothetical protein